MHHANITFEVCTETPAGVLAAARAGAQRVELCCGLGEGGLTPSLGLVAFARRSGLEVSAMLRPRGGHFRYDALEVEQMHRDLEHLKTAGAHGVVLGALTASGRVDEATTGELVEAARPLQVTFHRAFDLARDPHEALETVIRCGADRLLTSGQARTAPEGAPLIRELVAQASGRLQVMAGAGITPANARTVLEQTGVRELHFSASEWLEGDALGIGGRTRVTSERLIREIIGNAIGSQE